jgi:hypothetical protein
LFEKEYFQPFEVHEMKMKTEFFLNHEKKNGKKKKTKG